MTDITDTELDALEGRFRHRCSTRADGLALVAALRSERTQNHETRKALETLTRCIHEAHAEGETFPMRLSVACHAADELLART